MSLSPARAARMAALAHKEAQSGVISDENKKLYLQLRTHMMALKNIQSIKDKAIFKAEILPEYQGYIDGVLQAQAIPVDDHVFGVLLLWTVDAGQLDLAVEMAKLVIFNPEVQINIDGFQRTGAVAMFEEFAAQLNSHGVSDEALVFMTEAAQAKTEAGSHAVDMPDKVRAKYFKEVAEYYESKGKMDIALDLYRQALEYNEQIGVKTKIKELSKHE